MSIPVPDVTRKKFLQLHIIIQKYFHQYGGVAPYGETPSIRLRPRMRICEKNPIAQVSVIPAHRDGWIGEALGRNL